LVYVRVRIRKFSLEQTPVTVRIRLYYHNGYHRVYIRDGSDWEEIFKSTCRQEALEVLIKWFEA